MTEPERYTAADFRALAEHAKTRPGDAGAYVPALLAAAELADANLRGAAAFGAMSQRAEAAEAKLAEMEAADGEKLAAMMGAAVEITALKAQLAEAERQRDALDTFRRNVENADPPLHDKLWEEQ